MATVLVPTPLRRYTGGQPKVSVEADDISGLIQALDASYPGVAEKLLDGSGQIKRFINVFVNEDEVRTLQGLATPLGDADRVSIVPAMAGGAGVSARSRSERESRRSPGADQRSHRHAVEQDEELA